MTQSMGAILISFLSTLSLRRATIYGLCEGVFLLFLSTLSLRRATACGAIRASPKPFLSTLSLRRATVICFIVSVICLFLSTLSLRRATGFGLARLAPHAYFYPRSPCGERHTWARGSRVTYVISIHALLAESDKPASGILCFNPLFLSTLSLRRATMIL